jgi:hypothetical protein
MFSTVFDYSISANTDKMQLITLDLHSDSKKIKLLYLPLGPAYKVV